jgi:octaprenyl-diphosphate synthase
VWGNHLAVLGGDFLYTTAFELLLRSAPRDVIRVLCRCTLDMIDGEVIQPARVLQRGQETINRRTVQPLGRVGAEMQVLAHLSHGRRW